MDAEEVFYSASEGEEEEENPEEAGDFALNLPQEYNFGEPIVLRLCMRRIWRPSTDFRMYCRR